MLPEEKARVKIDKQLINAGWDIVSRDEYVPKSASAVKEALMQGNTESDIPYDIPNSWKWTRIGTTFYVEIGQSPDGSSVSKNGKGIEFHQGKIFFGDK